MRFIHTRRSVLALAGAALLLAAAGDRARAQGSPANAFIRGFADQLVGIINGPEPYAQKKAALGPVVDAHVDVPAVARFCLGRFWNSATPQQQMQYVTLFHRVLLNSISGHLGEYKGVGYRMIGDTPQGTDTLVGTIITRPNAPPANVQWVVDSSTGSPKVVDLVAEGTSLRLTTRSDYASYLSRHGDDIGALLTALQNQISNGS
jgi:phospholipid transport system substrate-binding protein